MLSLGIVGLPNVGKSTLFNALTAAGAEVSNYPFTTISPNVGMVDVPDERLSRLAAAVRPEKVTPAAIRFVDIAGLVEGASRGEGLGNQFLGEIRAVDAIVHVVRAFADGGVAHVYGAVDAIRDAEVIETELILADLQVLGRAMERRDKEWRTHPVEHARERERWMSWREALERGRPLRGELASPDERAGLKALGLVTGKPLLFVVNAAEGEDAEDVCARLAAIFPGSRAVPVAARLEAELQELAPAERDEMRVALGLRERGLDRVVRASYELLDLVTFYTVAKGRLQAWSVPRGATAPTAAGQVHSDMERGFVRAHVAPSEEVVARGGWSLAAAAGAVKTVGRDHVVEDGDVLEFLFHG